MDPKPYQPLPLTQKGHVALRSLQLILTKITTPHISTLSHRCELEQQTAICTLMADGSEANDPGTATETMTDITTADFFRLVTITAGFEALAAATGGGEGAAAKPTSAPTQSGDADDSTITAPPTAGTASSDSAADSAEETSPSTAAAPRATRDAVAAGFAALMGYALAL